MSHRRRAPTREGNAALVNGLQIEPLQVETLVEVAEIIDTTPEDLAWFPFGTTGVMYMSQSKQLDDNAPLNSSATLVAKKRIGIALGIRGRVVIFRESPPWGPLEGDMR